MSMAHSSTQNLRRALGSGAAGLALLALVVGCSPRPENADRDAASGVSEPSASWGADPADQEKIKPFLGDYDLWEDFEGGRVCRITLENARTIGGYAVTSDTACVGALKLGGDLFAWFPAEDGAVVLIDAARKTLARLEPLPDQTFYARRQDQGLENLVLSRP